MGLVMLRRMPLQLRPKRRSRPAQVARAKARATKAEAKVRAKRPRNLEKKFAKQQQAADAKLYHRTLQYLSIFLISKDLQRWCKTAKTNRNNEKAASKARAKEDEVTPPVKSEKDEAVRQGARKALKDLREQDRLRQEKERTKDAASCRGGGKIHQKHLTAVRLYPHLPRPARSEKGRIQLQTLTQPFGVCRSRCASKPPGSMSESVL